MSLVKALNGIFPSLCGRHLAGPRSLLVARGAKWYLPPTGFLVVTRLN